MSDRKPRSANKFQHIGSRVDSGITPRRVTFSDSPVPTNGTPRLPFKPLSTVSKDNRKEEEKLENQLAQASAEVRVLQKLLGERDSELGKMKSITNELNGKLLHELRYCVQNCFYSRRV